MAVFDLEKFPSLIEIGMIANEFTQNDVEFLLSKLYNSLAENPRDNGSISLGDPISSATALYQP